jgi:hypothetical protein
LALAWATTGKSELKKSAGVSAVSRTSFETANRSFVRLLSDDGTRSTSISSPPRSRLPLIRLPDTLPSKVHVFGPNFRVNLTRSSLTVRSMVGSGRFRLASRKSATHFPSDSLNIINSERFRWPCWVWTGNVARQVPAGGSAARPPAATARRTSPVRKGTQERGMAAGPFGRGSRDRGQPVLAY